MSDNEDATKNKDNQLEPTTESQATPQTQVSKNSRKHFKYRSNECLNCSQPLDLSDRYCPYCSQLNSTKQLSFGDFFTEFFSSLISYDSRLWFTLKDLLFKPGTITKKYIDGHRLRYANPFRFFLSVSIIYFLLITLVNFILPEKDEFNNIDTSEGEIVQYNTSDDEPQEAEIIAPYQNKEETYISNPEWEQEVAASLNDTTQAATIANNYQAPEISEEKKKDTITEIKQNKPTTSISSLDPSEKKAPTYTSEENLQKMNLLEQTVERITTYSTFWNHTEIKNASKALDSLNHPPTRINLWLYEKNNTVKKVKDNPREFVNYLAGKVPFFLFFFAPLFALFFWAIYANRKHNYMEHLVFIFHIFSFIFLAMIIAIIPDLLLGNDLFMGILFLLVGPFYFYKALRNFYKQPRLITFIKFVFLNIIFVLAISIFASIFFGITAATY